MRRRFFCRHLSCISHQSFIHFLMGATSPLLQAFQASPSANSVLVTDPSASTAAPTRPSTTFLNPPTYTATEDSAITARESADAAMGPDHSDFDECNCGCSLNTVSDRESPGNRTKGRSAWTTEIQSDTDVMKWATLCKFGRGINCKLCATFVKMRRYFDTSNWDSNSGHINGNNHLEKKGERQWADRREEIDRSKNHENGTVVVPPKLKGQATLSSLFNKQRQESSLLSAATSTSISSCNVSSTARAISLSPATSNTPVSKCCAGIIPRKLGMEDKLAVMAKYSQIQDTSNYLIKEYGELSGLYNLFSRGCMGEGVNRTRLTCPGIRCNECQTLWTSQSSAFKKIVRRRGGNLLTAERCLNAPVLSKDDANAMQKFIHNGPLLYFKEGPGTTLFQMLQHRILFYNQAKVCNFLLYQYNYLSYYSFIHSF